MGGRLSSMLPHPSCLSRHRKGGRRHQPQRSLPTLRQIDPLILDPLILDPLILDPLILDPLILDPLILDPLILDPLNLDPLILDPLILAILRPPCRRWLSAMPERRLWWCPSRRPARPKTRKRRVIRHSPRPLSVPRPGYPPPAWQLLGTFSRCTPTLFRCPSRCRPHRLPLPLSVSLRCEAPQV
jgi:hypothetical protein